MMYFDYTANTPASKRVLEAFVECEQKYIGNANSNHTAGKDANVRIQEATMHIATMLGVRTNEIIYTSGATESNNLAIKGIVEARIHHGKHIISTALEHTSVSASLSYLQEKGYEIDLCPVDRTGRIDLEELNELMRDDTVLVAISAVDSELGILQPVKEVEQIVRKYQGCTLHVDVTQALGKVPVDFSIGDTFSFAAHKIYGLNGIGTLIKAKNIVPIPQMSGGASTTIFRSGTPCTGLIVSLETALQDAFENRKENYQKVLHLNKMLRDQLMDLSQVQINSSGSAIPHILNIGVKGIHGSEMQKRLDEKGICVSVKSACSVDALPSRSVFAITRDKKRARESFRISLSHLTTEQEVNKLVQAIREIIQEAEL